MKKLLFVLGQCTWGSVQSLVGAVMFLCFVGKKHYIFHGAVVTEWNYGGSVSLGQFIFLSKGRDDVRPHEFGHSIQSLILGPLYLLVIGLPSVLWAGLPVCRSVRCRRRMSYFDFYTERWADRLSARFDIT